MRVWLPIVVGLAFGTMFIVECTHATVQAKPVDARDNEAEIIGIVPSTYNLLFGRPAEPLINVYRVIDKEHKNVCYIAINAQEDDEEPSISCLPQANMLHKITAVTE